MFPVRIKEKIYNYNKNKDDVTHTFFSSKEGNACDERKEKGGYDKGCIWGNLAFSFLSSPLGFSCKIKKQVLSTRGWL